MKQTFLVIIVLSGMYSCNSKPSGDKDHNNTPADGCYAYINDKDTVAMQLQTSGVNVNGKLMYKYFAKDKNTGSIKGELKGDTLWAQYTFMSEGTESTRPVVFLRKGETFVEGFGKLNDSTGQPDFSDKTAIHFDSKMILLKTDCANLKSLP